MKKVLVVDDEQLVRWFIERALVRLGFQTETAASTDEAITKLATGGYDMIFTDLRMPGANGADLVAKVSELPEDQRPVIVVCSAYISGDLDRDFKRKGINTLKKPFRLKELEETIKLSTHAAA